MSELDGTITGVQQVKLERIGDQIKSIIESEQLTPTEALTMLQTTSCEILLENYGEDAADGFLKALLTWKGKQVGTS